MNTVRSPQTKYISDRARTWIAVLSLVPWVLLTATGGGIHVHSARTPAAAVTPGSAAPAAGVPDATPRLRGDGFGSNDVKCAACLWQLYASVSLPHPPASVAVLPAAPSVSLCPAHISTADPRSFDPRGPPFA